MVLEFAVLLRMCAISEAEPSRRADWPCGCWKSNRLGGDASSYLSLSESFAIRVVSFVAGLFEAGVDSFMSSNLESPRS